MKKIIFKILPYFISFFAGVLIYVVTISHITDTNLTGLVLGIASGLLSIPLVFLFYETINQKCSKDLRIAIFQHISFEINIAILDVLKNLKTMLQIKDDINKDTLYILLHLEKKYIMKKVVFEMDIASEFEKSKQKIEDLVYRSSDSSALSDTEFQKTLAISKQIGIVSREILYQSKLAKKEKNNEYLSRSIHSLLGLIDGWIDLFEEDEIINHQSLRFI